MYNATNKPFGKFIPVDEDKEGQTSQEGPTEYGNTNNDKKDRPFVSTTIHFGCEVHLG